jgi:hypothetical protein
VERERRLEEAARLKAAQAAARIESRDWREGELQQEFDIAAGFDRTAQEAGNAGLVPDWREVDLQKDFHFAAGFDRDDEDSGDGDDGPAPDGNEDSDGDDKGPGRPSFSRSSDPGPGS